MPEILMLRLKWLSKEVNIEERRGFIGVSTSEGGHIERLSLLIEAVC